MHTKLRFKKTLSFVLCLLVLFQQCGFAQVLPLPAPLVQDAFRPLHLRYLSYDAINNNFKLLLDKGSTLNPKPQELKATAKQLLDYFSVGLALPSESFWVNLRPDGQSNIIDEDLARTDMGRVMLEADLQLKKDTANSTSPNTPEGRAYWDKLYKKAEELFGTENITIPTLTRVWIVPDEIILSESVGKASGAYIYKATLKVLLEQDYLKDSTLYNFSNEKEKALNDYSSQLFRESIIPKLTKEVNASKRYAPLRQVYYSLIMAEWFKARFHSLSSQLTVHSSQKNPYLKLINSRNLVNLASKTPWSKAAYFKAYQKSVNQGEYNIKETQNVPFSFFHETTKRYVCGGVIFGALSNPVRDAMKVGFGYARKIGTTVSLVPSAVNVPAAASSAIGVEVDESGEVRIDDNGHSAQIGKEAQVESVEDNISKVRDSEGNLRDFVLVPQGAVDISGLITEFYTAPYISEAHKRVILAILGLLEKSPPQFYAFDTLIADLFGFARPENHLIALHKVLARNPIALFHEIGEYLIAQGGLTLKLEGDFLIIFTEEGRQLSLGLVDQEAIAIAQKGPANPHYLLRALQREIFGAKDRALTYNIQQEGAAGIQSAFEQIEKLLMNLSGDLDPYGPEYKRLSDLFTRLSAEERGMLFAKLVKDEYNLCAIKDVSKIAGLFSWDRNVWQVVMDCISPIINAPEDLYYVTAPLINSRISQEARSCIWKILARLSDNYLLQVIEAVQAAGFRIEEISALALTGNNSHLTQIVHNLLINGAKKEISNAANRYARLILMSTAQSLRQGELVGTALVEPALNLLEPDSPSDRTHAARQAYIRQLLIINDIFQEAVRLITENPDISYDALYARLIPSRTALNGLTKRQRVLIKSALIRNRIDRLAARDEFEGARTKYPIEEFNSVAQDVLELYARRKRYARAHDALGVRQANQQLAELRERLSSLRRAVAPYLEEKFGIAAKDAPEIAVIQLGAFGPELYTDFKSLQKARTSIVESLEAERKSAQDKAIQSWWFKSNPVNIDTLRNILKRFPFYVFGNFQNEMAAYLTNAELRHADFDGLMDFYMDEYLAYLSEYVKAQDWFEGSGLSDGDLRKIVYEIRDGPEWQQVRQTLKELKQLLDDLVDVKATLIYRQMKEQDPDLDSDRLKSAAYRQASSYVLGAFQLVPLLKAERLKDLLAILREELSQKGLEKKDVLSVRAAKKGKARQSIETERLVAGFARNGIIVSELNGGSRVIDHERQHVIFGSYTGATAQKHTPHTRDFFSFMHKALLDYRSNPSELINREDEGSEVNIGGQADGGEGAVENGDNSDLSPGPGPPSISSTGTGNEIQANRNILAGILDTVVRQGLITNEERNRRLTDYDANPNSSLGEDFDLRVDNENVFMINGQRVVVINAPYLSVTEEGEQYASAGLRRGLIYITRAKFQEWKEQGILEQKIKHEQDEVAYLRKKALERFPGIVEALAYELMSDFLKDTDNAKQAKELIKDAHKVATVSGIMRAIFEKLGGEMRGYSLEEVRAKTRVFKGSTEINNQIIFAVQTDAGLEIYVKGNEYIGDIEASFPKGLVYEIKKCPSPFTHVITIEDINGSIKDSVVSPMIPVSKARSIDGSTAVVSEEMAATLRNAFFGNNSIFLIEELQKDPLLSNAFDKMMNNQPVNAIELGLLANLVERAQRNRAKIQQAWELIAATKIGSSLITELKKINPKLVVYSGETGIMAFVKRNTVLIGQEKVDLSLEEFATFLIHELDHLYRYYIEQINPVSIHGEYMAFQRQATFLREISGILPHLPEAYYVVKMIDSGEENYKKEIRSEPEYSYLPEYADFTQEDRNIVSKVIASAVENEGKNRSGPNLSKGPGTPAAGQADSDLTAYVIGLSDPNREARMGSAINLGQIAKYNPEVSERIRRLLTKALNREVDVDVKAKIQDALVEANNTPNRFSRTGGIDLRSLPIVRKATFNLKANLNSSVLNSLKGVDLKTEWQEIEDSVKQGAIPEAKRLMSYIQASCLKGNAGQDIDKVISCIADILRIEEERYSPTEPMLQDILIAVESASSVQQLEGVFVGGGRP